MTMYRSCLPPGITFLVFALLCSGCYVTSHYSDPIYDDHTTEVYYYNELNCNSTNFSLDLNRIINNFNTISVMLYQYFTTDIKGRPLNR